MPKEYQVFLRDTETELSPLEGTEPLLETDDLGEACTLAYDKWRNEAIATIVIQPRTGDVREYYGHQPSLLDVDEAGAGFEDWFQGEGAIRWAKKFQQLDEKVSLKHILKDAWHNSRIHSVSHKEQHAELLLHAPFPTTQKIELEDGETREQAVKRLSELYGLVTDVKHRGELAAIHFFDVLVIDMDGLEFRSDPVDKELVDFRTMKS